MTTVRLNSPIEIELNGNKLTVEIRKGESDPAHGIISADAPLAKALLSAQEGETKEFKVRDNVNRVQVLKIHS